MNPSQARRIAGLLALAAVLAAPALLSAQCAMCREAMEAADAEGGGNLARGFAYSIYILVGLPFVLFGTITFLLWRSCRRRPVDPRP